MNEYSRVKILNNVAKVNELLLIKACEEYPVPESEEDVNAIYKLIDEIKKSKDEIPKGKGYTGSRRTRTWAVSILEEKLGDYVDNELLKKGE